MIRHEQDGKNGERGLVGWAEADDESVVIVIDHFGRARHVLAHFGEGSAALRGNFRSVFRLEAGESFRGGLSRRHFEADDSTNAGSEIRDWESEAAPQTADPSTTPRATASRWKDQNARLQSR